MRALSPILIILTLLSSTTASAGLSFNPGGGGTSTSSSRGSRWWFSVGAFQAPLPSVVTFGLEYFVASAVSLAASYGIGAKDNDVSLSSWGFTLGLYPIVKWRLRPVMRFSAQMTSGETLDPYSLQIQSVVGSSELRNMKATAFNYSADFGLEWRISAKLRFGGGYGLMLSGAEGSIPYARLSFGF